MGKIIVAGIGPGSKEDITPAVLEAVREADAIVGYKYYFQFIEPFIKEGCECIDTGMKRERERAELAFERAREGKTVVVISSGDAGIYGMAPLIYEMRAAVVGNASERCSKGSATLGGVAHYGIEVVTLPGISAFQKAASLLGAPIGHDCCLISLSDLMTPWEVIERRIKAAAVGDFVTAVYNPKSHGRYWQLYRLQELFLKQRSAETPVGIVRQAGREEQQVTVTTLGALDPEKVDMFCVLIIGNSQSYIDDGKIITPRGYYRGKLQTPPPAPPLDGRGELTALPTAGLEGRGERTWEADAMLSGDNCEGATTAPLPCRNGNEDHRAAPLPCRGGAGGGVGDFNLCGGKLQTPPPTPPLDGRGVAQRASALPSHAGEGLGVGSVAKPGQQIMMESFRTIEGELRRKDWPLGHKWALLHAIHTTADFDMENILYTDEGAVEALYNKVANRKLKTIVTDVTMVTSGIRKGALARLGIEAKCYLSDPRVAELTAQPLPSHAQTLPSPTGGGSGGGGFTRTQAGIRLAVEEHPDALFVFGNAPTALMELCDLIRKGKARPAGIIAAPVGFVHVRESKYMVKPFRDIPKIIVEGRKGGSNIAATLCNAILTFDDAAQLRPGRDL